MAQYRFPVTVFRGLEQLEPRLLLSAVTSDDFEAALLNDALWQFIDPVGNSAVTVSGGRALISVPAGSSHDVWTAGNMAPRLMQQAPNEDFEIEIKFDSAPVGTYALNGIVVEADGGNFVRFDFFSELGTTYLFAASFTNGSPSVKITRSISAGESMYMRVKRVGNQWTQTYSYDGQTWISGASFGFALDVSAAGFFVGNAGNNPPAYTGSVDYFFNTAAPIVPVDETPPQVQNVVLDPGTDYIQADFATDETATVVVEYGLTTAYELGSVAGPAGKAHSLRIEGLTPETAYQVRIRAIDGSGNETITANYEVVTEAVPPPDTVPPQIGNIVITPGVGYVQVDFTTDETAAVAVDYGLTTNYELGSIAGPARTTHSVRIEGLLPETAYELRIRATDLSGNATTSDNFTAVTLAQATLRSDEFNSPTLNTALWQFVDPVGDAWLVTNGTHALISVPAGSSHDVWTAGNMAPRLMQQATDEDFEIEVKFDAAPVGTYALNGIVVEADGGNFVRFDFYSYGSTTYLFAASFSNGSPSVKVNRPIFGGASMFMRIKRVGDQWTQTYSYDGQTWIAGASFGFALDVTAAGFFVGNAGDAPPAFTGAVNYFRRIEGDQPPVDPPVDPPADPVIELWYGDQQQFGHLGNPQQWVNVLGRVSDPDGIASLSYTLNGGAARTLSIGPDLRRLENLGDFNIEIDRNDLTPGLNTIVITAIDGVGGTSVTTMTIDYAAGQTWSMPFTADWSQATRIDQLAQVVDGRWEIQADGTVHPTELGYDRIIALGDVSWTDYEVTVPITIHTYDPDGFRNPSNGPALGIMARWQGHYNWGSQQPNYGYWPFGGLAWYRWTTAGTTELDIWGNDRAIASQSRHLQIGVEYVWKMQVETLGNGQSEYRLKVWAQGAQEPAGWDLIALGDIGSLTSGSVLLVAHHVDASFGPVTVRPI